MKAGSREAFQAVSNFWPLIIAVGVGGVIGSNGMLKEFGILGLLVTVSIMIIVYGRIIGELVPDRNSGPWEILRENWLNYLIAVVVIGAPGIALRVLVAGCLHSLILYAVLATALSSALGILTIYALPIVFIKRSSLAAILAGIAFLSKNIASSAWIAGVVVITHVLASTGALVFRAEATPWSFSFAIVTGVLGAFLSFVTFAAASHLLLGDGGR